MKNFVDYPSRKCFASARVAASAKAPRRRNMTQSQNIIFWTSDPNNYSLPSIVFTQKGLSSVNKT
jgi:hypothetical protein